jgi:penicillin amidase
LAAGLPAPSALAAEFLPGLGDTVTVYEDQYGIPTIKGKSEEDVAFVQGYIHARDRFFQMDYFRKVSQGRLAEPVGSPALPNDLQLRPWAGARRPGQLAGSRRDQSALRAYANGVNAWLAANPLPPEYGGLKSPGGAVDTAGPWPT